MPSTPQTCLRIARAALPRSNLTQRTYVTQPLYLDFLLPRRAAQSSVLKASTRRRIATTSTPSPTATSTTTPPPQTTQQQQQKRQQQQDPSLPAPAVAIHNPRPPYSLSISPRASHRLHAIATKDANPQTALRVSIESGGCHGFQYLMNLVDLAKEPAGDEDTVFQGVRGEKVVVDEASLELLSGSVVDYTMELIGSQFRVTGIKGATSSCGCGTSFDIKLD